tara:strand:+ start:17388 stop:18377 length:990 start_codon:yes stop_codon:yes gene_type:complete
MANTKNIKKITDINCHWEMDEINSIYSLPFYDLLWKAQNIHRKNFDPNKIQISTLLSIKTGNCPENCSYCPQSGHFDTDIQKEKLLPLERVVELAKKAQDAGATRFCMGGAWRSPPKKDIPEITKMIKAVKDLGLETCLTAGMVDNDTAKELNDSGLDYYNHNIDTSPEYYKKIISTRNFQDRLDTLDNVRKNNIKVCCGGIIGMGENIEDRLKFLQILANMDPQPESVPINKLVPVPGTPLAKEKKIDSFDFVKIIALARVLMPKSYIRLSAGRNSMSEELQSLCFLAGANSIFYGEKLLTTPLPLEETDKQLFKKLNLQPENLMHDQ